MQTYKAEQKRFKKRCAKAKLKAWRYFVETTPDESRMAVLNKIIQGKSQKTINTLQKPDGTDTEPGLPTLQLLVDTHFPQATQDIPQVRYNADEYVMADQLDDRIPWISPYLTRRALRAFNPRKAPGPDQIRPIVFKYLPKNFVEYLSALYQSCVALHYTPLLWRESRVIFLPKPGKASYRHPKSFRPISLSNYFIKGLERLVVWQMDTGLRKYPIHPRQHGFTKGKSTESALSGTTNYAESYVMMNMHCVGIFLDISSAFDSISAEHIRHSLYKHGGETDLVEWYYNLLKDLSLIHI